MDRTYNVPLRKEIQKAPKYKRAKKAVNALKQFVSKHMKSDNVLIDKSANDELWKHGIKNPPHHIKVDCVKDDDKVMVYLEGKKPAEKKDSKKSKKEEKKPAKKEEKAEKKEEAKEAKKEVKAEKKEEEKKAEDKPKEVKENKKAESEKKAPAKEEKKETKASKDKDKKEKSDKASKKE